jgi:hypothetical protein
VNAIDRLTGLPTPVQIIAGVIGSVAILGLAYELFGNTTALIIIAAGIIVVILLLVLYKAILGWMRKRKANPLSQGLAGNAAAAPQGISEPARRARLDDLRRNFEQGVEKFRAAGKNLYSVPWYVLVGEPGSGKTEAIRHCNVGFPPGLQDQLQGAGGTLNMNWWFTNQAIILDTAGRLMFEEIQPGSTNEWQEFLKLLKGNRPNCPINGMLLVIPVDTLVKDSADQIEKKATKIAQQFEQIQRTLGVRFPVSVIITKCDLLNGFREFFDDLNDPQLQHQIMGWSNPAPLDERFDPAAVTTHLETVKQRLTERRQHLILDPVNTEDPQGRRIDQVDALYALPDSIIKIGPRLRRYLEMIFVAGEWSPKPLFLRGIYFTSSMTEGSALDAELAEVLGVPVDSLPEGRVWRRDRAYFLRDLFIEKVFREKGLVTRATNADKQIRTRQALVLAFGFIAVLLLIGLTVLGSRQLKKSIGSQQEFWVNAASYDPKSMQIIDKGHYSTQPIGKSANVASFFGDNLKPIQNDMDIPVLFKPMALFSGNINTERREAYRNLYTSTVLRPAYDASRKRISTMTDTWSPEATTALAQLLKLEYLNTGAPLPKEDAHKSDLEPMFRLVLPKEDTDKFTADKEKLQAVTDWVASDPATMAKLPAALGAGSQEATAAIDQGVASTIAYWRRQASDQGSTLAPINDVQQALNDFRTAENELLLLKNQNIDKLDIYSAFRDRWQAGLARLNDARDRAAAAWAIAARGKPDNSTLGALYTAETTRLTTEAKAACDVLLQYTPAPADASIDASKLSSSQLTLRDTRNKLEALTADLAKWSSDPKAKEKLADIAALDAAYLASIRGNDNALHHRFEVQAQLYALADKMVVKKDAPIQLTGTLDDAFAQADKEYGDADDQVKRPLIQATPEDRLSQAGALAQFVIDTSARAKKHLLAAAALNPMPTEPLKWPAFVAARATAAREDLSRPPVPLVSFTDKTYSPNFAPKSAGAASDALETVRKISTGADASARIMDAAGLSLRVAAIRKSFDGYRDEYIHYWRDVAREDLRINFKSYKELAETLVNVTEPAIAENLKLYRDKMVAALDMVGATEDSTAVKTAPQLVKEECRTTLDSWKNLGDDSRLARRAILAMDAGNFRDQFTVPSAKSTDSYLALYWQRLPLAVLDVLARDGRSEIDAGLTELARYERFPLAPLGDKKDDLSVQDVLNARAALEKVRGASNATGGTPVITPGGSMPPGAARIIAQGGITRDREVDALLDVLRGTNLLRNKQEYFDRVDKFLAALPADNKSFAATLSVDKDKLKDDNSVSFRYTYMMIAQNNKELRDAALNSTIADSCSVDYPGGDIALRFREVPKGAVVQTETFSGPWAILRLIRDPAAKVTRDGNKWTIEYTVTDPAKKSFSLWLTLEFKQPLPDLKEWPVPPGR